MWRNPPIDAQQDTRSRIIDTAIRLFTEQGMEATSLRRIADELGVTKAALYYHFPSRRELINALVAPGAAGMEALVSKLEADPEVTPQLVLEEYFDFIVEHRQVFQLLIRNPGILADLDLVPGFIEWRGRFETLLIGPDTTPDQRVRATVAFGGVGDCALLLQDIPVDDLRDPTVRSACDALGIRWQPRASP